MILLRLQIKRPLKAKIFVFSDSKITLNLVVEDQNQCTTSSSENVGESSLEEGTWAFVLEDLVKAINCSCVKDVRSSRLHHKSSSHCIKWI